MLCGIRKIIHYCARMLFIIGDDSDILHSTSKSMSPNRKPYFDDLNDDMILTNISKYVTFS